ncbi:uncharacterized protein [Spinacia oleracea]|uniref:MYB-CC type transcription factor LHEQLE-containing domain-containing protein n=1 Tax=Spinacia oleracea TaxID=3562 RepID=A0A9R0K7T3_SPIOL|nr:uncharacterized protein LOC110799868 [Spinacia oleracea]
MQCQSYFPVYHQRYDLNADANGGATPVYNGNVTLRSGHYNDYMPPLPVPPTQFAYKELMRRTMLLHEVAFRDQVQELHRIYARQKELMVEIKSKELYTNHLQLEGQSSNSSSAEISARFGQTTLHSLQFVNETSVNPVALGNAGTSTNLQFTESKGKKINGKLLDLELPAEMYIDSDEDFEEESLEDAEFLKAPTPSTLPSSKRSKIVVETCVMASTAKRSLGPILQGELFSPCLFSGTKTTLADLNEPLATSYLEESGGDKVMSSCMEIPENKNTTSDGAVADKPAINSVVQSDRIKSDVEVVGSASSGRKPSCLGQKPLVVQALPSLDNQLSNIKGARICGRRKGPLNNNWFDASPRCSPSFKVEKSLRSICSDSKSKECKTPDVNCFDLNSAEISNSEFAASDDASNSRSSTETVKKSKRCRMIDINLPCDPMTEDENSGQLNLNYCMNDEGLSPKSSSLDKTPLEGDLEAPISPEVEERSPPRGGDSEDNDPEEGGDHFMELAAEAIVSISSSKYHESLYKQKCEASDSGNLEWFAGLISSLSLDLEKDNCGIDDFEAMTLELPEMKAEEFMCKNNVEIPNETCSSMLLPCQTRRGRTRRSKRKDFQREVLPSLASLSRYEVTEDIQMMEGLMEAAGTPWHLSRSKRGCRMGRKPRVAKQQIFDDEGPPELRTFISCWGKVNRRPRGRRSPASSSVLSKWLEYAV